MTIDAAPDAVEGIRCSGMTQGIWLPVASSVSNACDLVTEATMLLPTECSCI